MNEISHKQAIQWIHRRLDGLLNEGQLSSLQEHLRSCDSCRAYTAEMDGLSTHMQNEFHRRWDEKLGPSQNVTEHVTAKAKRILLTNRIYSGAKLFTGAMTLIVLAIAINFVISRLQRTSPTANATESGDRALRPEDRLLAFTSDQNGNFDIYTMRADGTGLTNLTNHPANDSSPIWSRDGRHIAFESDRDGLRQIYVMDADGANLTRLSKEEADHTLPEIYDGRYNPWSPDSSRLVFVQEDPGGETAALYSVDVNGENEIKLADGKNVFSGISWSPDGSHVAFVLNGSPTPRETYVPDIYIVDSDGNKRRELKSFLPEGETLAFTPYYWSSSGQSIVFTSYTVTGGPLRQTLYEFDVITNTFSNRTDIRPDVIDWRDGIALRIEVNQYGTPYVWERPDGTTHTFEESGTWGESCSLDLTRSPQNNFAIGGYCPTTKFNLYWTNADGSTIKHLLTVPIHLSMGGVGDITWSPDEQYLAFNLTTDEKTEMYVVKVEEALANPATEPLRLSVSNDREYHILSWQPIIEENLARDVPTPQPKFALEGLLAFASDQNGNYDIYTMLPDGSGLTNITNNPAGDSLPFWSPDGQRIAFISDRNSSVQIYLMNADGSNIVQLTTGEGDYQFDGNGRNPWSPDGKKLIFSHASPGEQSYRLYVMDITDKSITTLTNEPGHYIHPSWSPDGRYIAFIADTGRIPRDLFVVGSDGNGLMKLTEDLPSGEFFMFDYEWSPDEMSLFFTTDRNHQVFQKATYTSTVYEASMDGSVAVAAQETDKPIMSWWNGFAVWRESEPRLTWLRPDGSQSTLDLCPDNGQLLGTAHKRSYSGNLVVGSNCSDSGWMLYWANPDGTTTNQLLTSPVSADEVLFSMTWSPDDRYLAFVSLDTTSPDVIETLYVLDVAKAQENPSIQPLKMTNSLSPSWQPVPISEVVEEQPIPEPTQVPVIENFPPIGTGINNGEWIAFIGGEAVPDLIPVNQDVYMIHPDGSGLVNLTQSPAHYYYLQWSPDGQHLIFIRNTADSKTDIMSHHVGETSPEVLASTVFFPIEYNPNQHFEYSWSPDSKQIAFLDKPAGNYDIYTINADGSNEPELRQLTNDPGQEIDFAWSPDGSQIAYQKINGDQISIMVMNADGSDQHEVARGTGEVRLSWSRDGKSLYAVSIYLWERVKNSRLECEACVDASAIYQIDLARPSVRQIYSEHDTSKIGGWYLYDTSQSTLYFMRVNPPVFVEFWGTWFRADGNSVTEIGEMDPQQTCKTTTVLNEYISPNPRFSAISNFCAARFDLYLADRETTAREKRFIHLLQLPLAATGQGGDFATLPVGWSPDGRWLVYDDGNQSIYLLDVEQTLWDPTTEPSILFQSDSNSFMLSELAWQPKP